MKVITAGRSSSNTITVDDEKASRRHCQITQDDYGRCSIVDLNSTNGTYVNERRITSEYYLNPNDMVRIGRTTIPWQRYVAGGATARHTQRTVGRDNNQPVVVNVNQPPKNSYRPNLSEESVNSGYGVAALVCGIVGIFLFGIILGTLAVIFGAVSIKRNEKRKGCGIAGLILGILDLALYIIILLIAGSLFFWAL
ncbi:MAG: FHA domain-containing protein [Candidatus Symbiothrix sp.]|jgi:hypothetical protein|nr:FHA domain-containing protein [Candidatus Symbiothrix sp.]